MINFSRFLFISLLVLTVIFGLEQLSFENKVFANTRAYCCNLNPSDCNGQNCDADASVKTLLPVKPWCTSDYMITCRECIELTQQGELCPPAPTTAWCDDDGECYGWCDGHWVLGK